MKEVEERAQEAEAQAVSSDAEKSALSTVWNTVSCSSITFYHDHCQEMTTV